MVDAPKVPHLMPLGFWVSERSVSSPEFISKTWSVPLALGVMPMHATRAEQGIHRVSCQQTAPTVRIHHHHRYQPRGTLSCKQPAQPSPAQPLTYGVNVRDLCTCSIICGASVVSMVAMPSSARSSPRNEYSQS